MSAAGPSQGANYSPLGGGGQSVAAALATSAASVGGSIPRFIEPVTLTGTHATVEPLAREHESAIREAAADGELWNLWYTSVPAPDKTSIWLDIALDMRERLGAMPFVVRDKVRGDIVGSTRYFNVDAANRRLEIGHTWYAQRAQRTAINTECKLLLLTHAFERLGAKQDGVLRNHQLLSDGSRRDTVVFSILDGEWAAVKRHLSDNLDGR